MVSGIKISQLNPATTLDGTESLPIVQSGATVKATTDQIKTLSQTNVPAANVFGALTNATIAGSGVTGTITTATIPGSSVTGTLTTATVPAGNVSGALTGATIDGGSVTGTVPILHGGTGKTTANAAFNALVPSQSTNANKFLKTNGTNASWDTPSGSDVSIGAGTTAITDGTSGRVLYDNAGVVGEYTTTGTAGSVVLSDQPTFTTGVNINATGTAFMEIGGTVGAYIDLKSPFSDDYDIRLTTTGSGGSLVAATSSTLTLESGTGTIVSKINGSARFTVAETLTTFGTAMSYGGVTLSNSVTGTGSMVLGTSPQFTTGIGINTAAATAQLVTAAGSITGSTAGLGVSLTPTIQSGVTGSYLGYYSAGNTTAAAFTLNSVRHFQTNGITPGAGSTIANQYGFFVESTFTQAGTNFGFYGGMNTGAGRYNLYMAGTADNYLGGPTTFNSAITYGGVTLSNSVTGTGSMVLSASPTLTGTVTLGSASYTTSSNTAPLAMARAWVNFNGGSGAINGSMNVSSITVNSAGQYTVNMTTAAPNTNYARVASGNGGPGVFTGVDWNTVTTSSFSVYCANTLTQGYQAGNPVNAVAYW